MGQQFYILLFFTGVIQPSLTQSDYREFILVQQNKTWSEAQDYCRFYYTELAVVRNASDLVQLQSEAQQFEVSSDAWIGLYLDFNSWRWSLDNTPVGPMIKWSTSNPNIPEPNNNGGNQLCTAIKEDGWWDLSCGWSLPFMCFDDKQSGNSTYVYYSVQKSWYNAQSYCRKYHTDLASTRNTSEYTIIIEMVSEWTWIGLFRDGWKWVNKSNTFPMTWMTGQPDNAMWSETCAYLKGSKVADALCSDMKPFFCYSVNTRRMIRLKIDSNEDVNNPEVKASILEKLRQKLKDQGIVRNFIIKWKEQADGVVFHKMNNTAIVDEKTCNLYF